jgi:2-dehydro-3-deoxy-D-arabinonate dehydratase
VERPEPELTLASTPLGKIVGYTIGNDVSSRDIEGENPLYLRRRRSTRKLRPRPGVLMSAEPPPTDTPITWPSAAPAQIVFEGSTTLAQLRRRPDELVEYLFRDNEFPAAAS